MKKITIVLPSILTVPAVKGGAVEQLLEEFINMNEIKKEFYLDIVAHYDKKLEQLNQSYKCCVFHYIKFPDIVIRGNSVLCNKKIINVDVYEALLNREVAKIGNQYVVVEGGLPYAIRLKRKNTNIKLIFHSHGDPSHYTDKELDIINSFESIICVSNFCKSKFVSSGVKEDIIKVLHNGIDTKLFLGLQDKSFNDICNMFRIPSDKKIILFFGRIVKEKGIYELIKAFKMLNRNDTILVVVGGKNFGQKRRIKDSYSKLIYEESKKNSLIKMLGYVEHKDMPYLLKISTACVLPSVWDEPFSLAVIETMISGCPLITTNRGGTPEILEGTSVSGIDTEKDFIKSLANQINLYLSNEKLRNNISNSQKARTEYFDTSRYFSDFVKYLHSLIG